MPHDKHGRKIEVGDVIKARPYNYGGGKPAVGRVVVMREGQHCSGDAAFFCSYATPYNTFPVVDAFGADEAELVMKADGSEPEAPKEGA